MRLGINFVDTLLAVILMNMLILGFNAMSVLAETEEWVPIVPGTNQVDFTFWMENQTAYIEVYIEFMHGGYNVSDWGYVVIDGYEISVDSEIWMWTGVSIQVITTLCHTYNLGELEDGSFTFTFEVWGTPVKDTTMKIQESLLSTLELYMIAIVVVTICGIIGYALYRKRKASVLHYQI